jgi:AraC family transcriptional regulator
MLRVREQTYEPGLRQARHAHAETTVTIVVAGSLRERVGRVDEIARPLSVVVKPGGTEHADEFGPHGARTLQIALIGDAAGAADWEVALRTWRWTHAGPAVRSFLALLRAVRSATSDGRNGELPDEIEYATHDVLAALGRQSGATHRMTPPNWLRLVREELDDAAHVTPRVRVLAASAGVHPVYLARQFRRFYGCWWEVRGERWELARSAPTSQLPPPTSPGFNRSITPSAGRRSSGGSARTPE